MKLFSRILSKKVGLPPGTIEYSGESKEPSKVELIQYDCDHFNSSYITNVEDLSINPNMINWINVVGFSNVELIKSVSEKLELHNIFLEDVFNIEHAPKHEEYQSSAIIILKNYLIKKNKEIDQNHCAIFYGGNVIVTFQEFYNPVLAKKVERISKGLGKTRTKKSDYLLFLLLDAFVDTYYTVFEELRIDIETIEEELLINKKKNKSDEIYHLNKRINYMRKNVMPLKEAITKLYNDETEYIVDDNKKYFNDVLDHVKDIVDYYKSFESLVKGLIDLNENNVNSNANEVMKTLTIVASIFIPLSFIAGLFGMNFENMPELKWTYGYYITLVGMLIISVAMLIYMKIKKWF